MVETSLLSNVELIYSPEMAAKASFPDWLKTSIAVVVPVIGALVWFSAYHVPAVIDSQTKELSGTVAGLVTETRNTRSDVQRIDAKVDKLLTDALHRSLSDFKAIKHEKRDIAIRRLQSTAELVRAANQAKLLGDTELVAQAGKNALDLAKSPELGDAAWQLAKELIDYSSLLHASQAPNTAEAQSVQYSVRLTFRPLPGATRGELRAMALGRAVSPQEAAVIGEIGKEDQFPLQPEYIVMQAPGFEIKLDRAHLKNVILVGAQIHYDGGPLILQNVYFVNCQFVINKGTRGQQLAANVLTSAAVTFKAS